MKCCFDKNLFEGSKQGWEFALLLIRSLLIRSLLFRSFSLSLKIANFKEQPWAIRLRPYLKKSDHERFAHNPI